MTSKDLDGRFSKPNPFAFTYSNVCRVREVHLASLPRPTKHVRLALVSAPPLLPADIELPLHINLPLSAKAFGGLAPPRPGRSGTGSKHVAAAHRELSSAESLLDDLVRGNRDRLYDLHQRARRTKSVAVSRKQRRPDQLKCFRQGLQAAVRGDAHIICFSEMAFPTNAEGTLHADAMQEAWRTATERRCLIVGGTAHNRECLHNICPVFFPRETDEEKSAGHLYYKQISATALNPPELVSVPSVRFAHMYVAFGLRIGVLVCADLADYSSVAGFVPEANLLLVPCHSHRFERLQSIAAATSIAMNGVVALANCHDHGIAPSTVVNYCGKTPKSDSGAIRRTRKAAQKLSGGGQVSFFDIDVNALRDRKIAPPSKEHEGFRWLFGLA